MNYNEHWNLESIPDAPFYSEVGRRRGKNSGGARPGAGHPFGKGKRCVCGQYLLKTAKNRSHKCEAK